MIGKRPVRQAVNSIAHFFGSAEKGMNGKSSNPAMKNGEGTAGIPNRLLKVRGGVFSSKKHRGCVPSGAVQVIAIAGWHCPKLRELSSSPDTTESRQPEVLVRVIIRVLYQSIPVIDLMESEIPTTGCLRNFSQFTPD